MFLAGCFWMAQYYIMAGELPKTKSIINEALKFSTDLVFLRKKKILKEQKYWVIFRRLLSMHLS
jgi:hypothetical protein